MYANLVRIRTSQFQSQNQGLVLMFSMPTVLPCQAVRNGELFVEEEADIIW